ncbi:traB domain-containing protein-like [Paramacrobiotus metropolitanus]|uniref:traB domain-containing protein-like n=1 Tax=Paramacrobiotus metropolitanus TaxID=2943436 RepID=UPI0024465931|nr:traB domain-containing protein-like [Paramacrobiotus metropolitanus]
MEDASGYQQREDGHDETSHPGLDANHAAQGEGHGDYTLPDILKPIPTGFPVRAGRLRPPKFRIANPDLPDTVTMLEHPPSGGRVYLVGTVHNADKSQEDVGLTIRMVRPDSVLLELCLERQRILTMPSEDAVKVILSEEWYSKDNWKLLGRRVGWPKTILAFLVQRSAALYLKNFGLPLEKASDMRAAYMEVMTLSDCTLYLGDRPRSITRQRIRAAPLRERLWLLRMKIRAKRTGMEAFWQINAETRRALMQAEKEKFATACPTVYRVLVQERDVWLTEALKRSVSQPLMTTAGPRGRVAVGVVGMAHVAGIHRAWNGPRPSSDALRKLAEVPPASKLLVFAPGILALSSLYRGGRLLFSRLRALGRN